jgi:AraC family transcriptional regulator
MSGLGPTENAERARRIDATVVESLWGVRAKAKGFGSRGFSAALWNARKTVVHEIVRPACDHTHVISIWNKGSVRSELSIDNRIRFHRVRHRGSFQMARAGESVRAVLSQSSGTCLDIYLPAAILTACFLTECETARGPLELLPLGLERDPVISRLGDDIAAEILSPGLASAIAIDSAMFLLAVNLIRRWSNQAGMVKPTTGGLAPWQARHATDYLRDHLAQDVTLAELAALVNLSPFHFARAFKQSVGKPPHAYQFDLRVEQAKGLLAETTLPVTEIASLVGYDAPQTLARAFQRAVGLTPTAYRRQRRE